MVVLYHTCSYFFFLVAADFTISLIPKMVQVDNAFSLEKKSGLLAAMKKEKISVTHFFAKSNPVPLET